MQAKKTSLTLLYIVVYTVLLHAETLCKLVTCCPSSEWECRGLKNEEMVQGATKDRKGNPRNVQKRKSLAAGLAGNCGPEGDILQLIWKAYSNSKNILKKKGEAGMWMNYLMERVVEYHRFTGGLLNKGVLQLSKSDLIYLFSVFFFSAEYTLKLALGQYFQIMKTN